MNRKKQEEEHWLAKLALDIEIFVFISDSFVLLVNFEIIMRILIIIVKVIAVIMLIMVIIVEN